MIDKNFKKWALGFSGCDGGDLGDKTKQSIWFCGIEWGGGFSDNETKLQNIFREDISVMKWGYDNESENLSCRFNWRAMKLLSAINGSKTSDYKTFANNIQPFVKGKKGYFKLNLYPLSFKNTSKDLWSKNFTKTTGFKNKDEYKTWIKQNRFPKLQELVKKHNPKLIICTGITYKEDFIKAFSVGNIKINKEIIDDKKMYWFKNFNGTVVVIIYFMIGRFGLTKDSSVQKVGKKISEIIK